MSSSFRRSILATSIAAFAVSGFLAGCEKKTTTTQTPSGATTTTATTTTTIAPSDAASQAGASMRAAASEVATGASQAMTKAGDMVEDSVITAKVKTALLADPDVKGLSIDVDTKDGVVTLKGTADKTVNLDRAMRIAKDTGGVKSVNNQLVVKSSS